MKLKLTPSPVTEQECAHPTLKDCGGGYWWCMWCMERLTTAELVALRAAQKAEKQTTGKETENE